MRLSRTLRSAGSTTNTARRASRGKPRVRTPAVASSLTRTTYSSSSSGAVVVAARVEAKAASSISSSISEEAVAEADSSNSSPQRTCSSTRTW